MIQAHPDGQVNGRLGLLKAGRHFSRPAGSTGTVPRLGRALRNPGVRAQPCLTGTAAARAKCRETKIGSDSLDSEFILAWQEHTRLQSSTDEQGPGSSTCPGAEFRSRPCHRLHPKHQPFNPQHQGFIELRPARLSHLDFSPSLLFVLK